MNNINYKQRIAELKEDIAQMTEILDDLELELRELQERSLRDKFNERSWKQQVKLITHDKRVW